MRTQSSDTDLKAEQIQIELWRKKSTAQKMFVLRSMTQTAIQLSRRVIARANPGFNAP